MVSSNDKIVKLLQDAVAAVDTANVPSDLRASAFRVAAERLDGSVGDATKLTSKSADTPLTATTTENRLSNIATKLGLQTGDVAKVFDVDDDGVHLVVARSRLDNSKRTAMQEVLQLVVAARQALGEEWTAAADVRAVADDRGVLNAPNWAAAIKALDGAGFRFRGSTQAREVKINHVGYEAAAKLASRLISGA
jgi:hypothetical protein